MALPCAGPAPDPSPCRFPYTYSCPFHHPLLFTFYPKSYPYCKFRPSGLVLWEQTLFSILPALRQHLPSPIRVRLCVPYVRPSITMTPTAYTVIPGLCVPYVRPSITMTPTAYTIIPGLCVPYGCAISYPYACAYYPCPCSYRSSALGGEYPQQATREGRGGAHPTGSALQP